MQRQDALQAKSRDVGQSGRLGLVKGWRSGGCSADINDQSLMLLSCGSAPAAPYTLPVVSTALVGVKNLAAHRPTGALCSVAPRVPRPWCCHFSTTCQSSTARRYDSESLGTLHLTLTCAVPGSWLTGDCSNCMRVRTVSIQFQSSRFKVRQPREILLHQRGALWPIRLTPPPHDRDSSRGPSTSEWIDKRSVAFCGYRGWSGEGGAASFLTSGPVHHRWKPIRPPSEQHHRAPFIRCLWPTAIPSAGGATQRPSACAGWLAERVRVCTQ